MDSQESVREAFQANYRGALALLLPLLRAEKKLLPQQELGVMGCLSNCYRFLGNFKAALPHVRRELVLTKQLFGARSKEHAWALQGLCMVHRGLKAFPEARKAIGEALAIMEELGEEYGSMLVQLGRLDREQGRYKEALVIFGKASRVGPTQGKGRLRVAPDRHGHLPPEAAAVERGRRMLQGSC